MFLNSPTKRYAVITYIRAFYTLLGLGCTYEYTELSLAY